MENYFILAQYIEPYFLRLFCKNRAQSVLQSVLLLKESFPQLFSRTLHSNASFLSHMESLFLSDHPYILWGCLPVRAPGNVA